MILPKWAIRLWIWAIFHCLACQLTHTLEKRPWLLIVSRLSLICYRPRMKYDRKVMFSVCQSVHWGGGYPSLWFQVPSLGRGYPSFWSQVPSWGGEGQVLGQGYPLPTARMGGGEGQVPKSGPRSGFPLQPRQHTLAVTQEDFLVQFKFKNWLFFLHIFPDWRPPWLLICQCKNVSGSSTVVARGVS